MGTSLSKNDQINQQLNEQYEVQSLPYLLHRKTQESCILLKLTAHSVQQSSKIQQIIQEYGRTKCQSISKLRSKYHVQNTGYCSDEQHFYLVFDGHNNYTICDEVTKRRHFSSSFNEFEIQQIITTLLCGLREYDHRFQREYQNISIDRVVLDIKSKRIYLADPWLAFPQRNSHYPIRDYPSPQKLRATYQNKLQDVNPFLSNLFSIGIMALELNRLTPQQSVYLHKREINQQQLNRSIRQFRSEKLRKGIQCLVGINPVERKKIYQIWGIQNKQNHYLQSLINKAVSLENNEIKLEKKKNSIKKFQFPAPVPQQPSMKIVKSEAILNQEILKTNKYVPFHINSQSQYPAQNIGQIPKVATNYQPPITFRPQSQFSNSFQPQSVHQTTLNNSGSQKPYFSLLLGQRPPNFNQIYASQMNKSGNNKVQQQYPKFAYNPQIKNPNYRLQNLQQVHQYKPSQSINLPNSLSSYKESILYYEPIRPQSKVSDGTIGEPYNSPIKQTYQNIKEQNAIKLQKIQYNEPSSKNQEQQQPTALNNLAQQSNQQIQTPNRPKKRNHFNSTIVEVKDDQDTPDHQHEHTEQVNQQYVVQQYETGSRYQGYKSKQMRNGQGKFYYQDGGYYEGHWRNNKMDGYGKLYYQGGKLAYEGEWSQDQFNGIGKVYNDNPVKLENEFDYTDFGLIQDYWEYYEGYLSHDTKQGRGKIKLSNGQYFQGDFHNDLVQGFGKFHTDDRIIEGIWRQSKLIKVISTIEK